jgi:protein-S-isoprenylcysteine O-methyltransferase Ste14
MTRAVLSSVALLLFLAACLLLPARRLDWPMAWAVLAFYGAWSMLGFRVLSPQLIAERSRLPSDADPADLALAGLAVAFLYPVSFVVCGLDARAGGTRAPGLAEGAAFLVFAAGYAFSLWAAHVNPFFSAAVRIQSERGHHVIDQGPYAWLRHPGYAGPIASHLALPLALGSTRALAPAALGAVLLTLRALYEERRLLRDLPGYEAYAARVRYRLVPGVW